MASDEKECTMNWSAQPLWFYILLGTSSVLLLAAVVLTGLNCHQFRLMKQAGGVPLAGRMRRLRSVQK